MKSIPALLLLAIIAAAPPATIPSGADPQLWRQLLDINHRSAQIKDVVADFRQEKFTSLLKKPLVSTGRILVKGSAMIWRTADPEPTIMRIDESEIRLYYPRQKILEIYPLNRELGSLAASPLPRLDVLQRFFSFQKAPAAWPPNTPSSDSTLALELLPTSPSLREHLDSVRVLLDSKTGLILQAEMTDADQDRTEITFTNAKTNTGLKDDDLQLSVPSSVKVTHPLDGLDAQDQQK